MHVAQVAVRPAPDSAPIDTQNKPFRCVWPGCTESYTRRPILQNHINAEHKQIRQTCAECGKAFRYANDLKQHQKRIHQKQRAHVCRVESRNKSNCACARSFATSSELYRHHRAAMRKKSSDGGDVSERPPELKTPTNTAPDPETVGERQMSTLCISPSQTGPLDDFDRTLNLINYYARGSFECGFWFLHRSGYASSAKSEQMQYPRLLLPFNSVKAALSVHEYEVAVMQLKILCQEAYTAIQIEDPVCFLDSLLIYLEVIAVDTSHRQPLIAAHDLVMKHLWATSTRLLGPRHPWTITMRLLAQVGYNAISKQMLLTVTQLLLACFTTLYGAHSPAHIRFRLLIAVYTDDEGEPLRQTMQRSVESLSLEDQILHPNPQASRNPQQPSHPSTEVDHLTQSLMKAENNESCRRSGRMVLLRWAHRAAVRAHDWHRAAAIIANGVMPLYTLFFGEEDASQDQWLWLLRLEEALAKSAQMEAARQARLARLALTRFMEAKVAEKDRLPEQQRELDWRQEGRLVEAKPEGAIAEP